MTSETDVPAVHTLERTVGTGTSGREGGYRRLSPFTLSLLRSVSLSDEDPLDTTDFSDPNVGSIQWSRDIQEPFREEKDLESKRHFTQIRKKTQGRSLSWVDFVRKE